MQHERHHWLEKLQVKIAGAFALAVTFFIVGPMHGWWDPQWPATFVPTGSFGRLLNFALLVWILAAACAVVTVSARPEGALFATMVGAAGVSMHSAPIRVLFWSNEASLAGVFIQLIVELLVLLVITVGAVHIIFQIRSFMARICPAWMWKGRITAETVVADSTDALAANKKLEEFADGFGGLLGLILGPEGMPIVSSKQEAKSRKTIIVCTASCLAASVLYSSIILMLLMRSPERGQIIFALFASFLLATLIAHQQFATRFSVAAWAAPLITGVVFYMLAIASSGDVGPNAWIRVQLFARALPVDWMAAGGAGSVLGYWISERIHELRHIERHAENESA